jgi:hypothetical protein
VGVGIAGVEGTAAVNSSDYGSHPNTDNTNNPNPEAQINPLDHSQQKRKRKSFSSFFRYL